MIDWVAELAGALDRRMMVRLVKGAYWDTEIKRAQERGLADYPVFTRKAATDLSYLACAKRLLAARPRLYPQFATHNALTVATILEMAGDPTGFEFQRLHGMGEALYEAVTRDDGRSLPHLRAGRRPPRAARLSRPPAPGERRQLVLRRGRRRPLRAGRRACSSARRSSSTKATASRHSRIPLPANLYAPARRNSKGMEFGDRARARRAARRDDAAETGQAIDARPLLAGEGRRVRAPVMSPIDGKHGRRRRRDAGRIDRRGDAARPTAASPTGRGRRPPSARRRLERLSDLLEAERDALVALLAREGGKTLDDGIAEVREAVDFCRYYAAEARRLFADDEVMPGPTGERDVLRRRGRGVFVCISPWNFPLAIFLGQVAAALAAGNAVIAKPAEQTPLIAFRAFELLHRAGVPQRGRAARARRRQGRRGAGRPSRRRRRRLHRLDRGRAGRSTGRLPPSTGRSCRSSPRPAASTP